MDAGHEPDKGQVSRRSFSVQRQLLERDVELSALEGLIDASSRGGRLLAIEGPPGIGKTSLIAEAKALAQEAGMLVLAARGSELEQPFSYGIVRQLLEPHLASLDDETRTAATSGAAALATPLFDPAGSQLTRRRTRRWRTLTASTG